MQYYRGAQVRILHPAAQRQGAIISRTGYTGEDGFELSLGAGIAAGVWEVLMELGQPLGIVPAGLGARDTLRLEAGMPLYGHELSEADRPFRGRPGFRLPSGRLRFPRPRRPAADPRAGRQVGRIGLELPGKRAPGRAAPSSPPGRPLGEVTSGSYSPSLGKPIAMGYVAAGVRPAGRELQIDIRGHIEPARVVELPFYRREKKGIASQ